MSENESGNELVQLNGVTHAELFSDPEIMTQVIDRIDHEVKKHIPDTTTAKGRAAIASMAFKVARSKVFLDDIGKGLTAELKSKIAEIDKNRKNMRMTLDHIRDEVRTPLDEWEAAEEIRKKAHEDQIASIQDLVEIQGLSSAQLEINLTTAQELFLTHEWEEFKEKARAVYDKAFFAITNEIRRLAMVSEIMAEQERARKEIEEERAKLNAERARLRAERKKFEDEMRQFEPPGLAEPAPTIKADSPAETPAIASKPPASSIPPDPAPVVSKTKYSDLNETTFLQMAQALKALLKLASRFNLDQDESQMVAQAEELRQTALAELKRSGVNIE